MLGYLKGHRLVIEINAPNNPIKPKPKITNPIGTRLVLLADSSTKVGIAKGAGGVKVGKRVGVSGMMNAAARVGSIVGVTKGVGVGGASTTGR